VAVDDLAASTRRAIELGGGTADAGSSGRSDVGEWTVLIDPDGNRFGIFHGRMRGRHHGRKRSGMHDGGPQ
jgi:predicted enzyme related to lactoylglutathione lyase